MRIQIELIGCFKPKKAFEYLNNEISFLRNFNPKMKYDSIIFSENEIGEKSVLLNLNSERFYIYMMILKSWILLMNQKFPLTVISLIIGA